MVKEDQLKCISDKKKMSKSIITFTYSATKLLLYPCKEVFGPF